MKSANHIFFVLLLLLLPVLSRAQGTKVITGTVVDEAGLPVPGAVVMVSGTTRGTSADIDGKYSISVSAKETLEFSSSWLPV